MEVFECGFVQLYGMTETCGSVTYLPPEDHSMEIMFLLIEVVF